MSETTAPSLSPRLLQDVSDYVGSSLGLDFPAPRWIDIERALKAVAGETGADPESLGRQIVSGGQDSPLMEKLTARLTIGETYFFREQECFAALENHVLPELIDEHREDRVLRIWSASCSTGEEPYSIAILVLRMLPSWRDWNISILATDVNHRSLARGASGIYGEWSFRQMPAGLREAYFDSLAPGRWRVREVVRKMVTFASLNLAGEAYPSAHNGTHQLDIVFCRNTLMYFLPRTVEKCMERFHGSLQPRGWLILSAAEGNLAPREKFSPVLFPGTILYRRESGLDDHPRGQAREAWLGEAAFTGAIWEQAGEKYDSGTPTLAFSGDVFAAPPAVYFSTQNETQNVANAPDEKEQSDFLIDEAKRQAGEGNLAGAEEFCRKAIEADRQNALPYYLMASILEEGLRDEEALISLKKAIYLDAEFVVAHLALGGIYMRRGRPREGKKQLLHALKLLKNQAPENTVPESGGLTVAGIREMIIHRIEEVRA